MSHAFSQYFGKGHRYFSYGNSEVFAVRCSDFLSKKILRFRHWKRFTPYRVGNRTRATFTLNPEQCAWEKCEKIEQNLSGHAQCVERRGYFWNFPVNSTSILQKCGEKSSVKYGRAFDFCDRCCMEWAAFFWIESILGEKLCYLKYFLNCGDVLEKNQNFT